MYWCFILEGSIWFSNGEVEPRGCNIICERFSISFSIKPSEFLILLFIGVYWCLSCWKGVLGFPMVSHSWWLWRICVDWLVMTVALSSGVGGGRARGILSITQQLRFWWMVRNLWIGNPPMKLAWVSPSDWCGQYHHYIIWRKMVIQPPCPTRGTPPQENGNVV